MRKHVQSGSALIISLVFLLILTMIGIASIQDSTLQERMAGNERDRNLAFQTAEAALRVGEDHLRQAGIVFSASGTNGLMSPDYTGVRPIEDNYPWANRSQQVSDSYAGVTKRYPDIPLNGSRPRPSHRAMKVRFPLLTPTE